MKFHSLCHFSTTCTITLAVFLIILTTSDGKNVRVHSSVLLSVCEQRDEFIKQNSIQRPIKTKPISQEIECGWFRIPTCPTSDSGCTSYKICKVGRGTKLQSKKQPQLPVEPIVCPAPTPTCPACSGREWAEKIEAPLADD